MKYPKIDPAKSQAGQVSEHREPYEPPTVTVVPLKIEERLLACAKFKNVCPNPPRIS
jgi:hypothetical protein